ncbi:HDIG domain-containing metalloprotein [Pelotomaculum sp. PtaB.Bin117]|uniref:HD family phosphohydrolase n=1 Tax=Pelotomaculum sp. PtaB.Bin117 TaxID=1811694 RepID=UPI0009CFD1A9|nr:HDIG domain-containing metalloprotein [Pelotomaculum sp. PtaB.Bin117]OPX87071.1 MAG: Ribonuclease Y [Pelotomaculum sp. PtaB.Bin117]
MRPKRVEVMPIFSMAKDKIKAVLSRSSKQRWVRRGSAAILFLFLTTFLMSFDFVNNKVNLTVGQASPKTFKAENSAVFENEVQTEAQRQLAADKVGNIYAIDPQVSISVQKDISDLFQKLREVQGDAGLNISEKIDKLRTIIPFAMLDSDLDDLAHSTVKDSAVLETELNKLISDAMGEGDGIPEDKLKEFKKAIEDEITGMRLSKHYEHFAKGAANYYVRPNAIINKEKTRQLKDEAYNAVPPVMVSVKEGEKIVGEGEILTEENLVKLQALDLIRTKPVLTSILGVMMLLVLLMVVVLLYLYQQNREIYEHAGHLYLLGIIVLIVLGVGKLIIAINVSSLPEFSAQFGYMVPMGAAGMLTAILLDSRLAVLIVAVMSLMLGVMTGSQLQFGLVGLIGGITGVYSVSKLSQRGDLVRAGFYTSFANILAIFSVGLVTEKPFALIIFSSLALGLASGILSSILTNGALPFLENTFRLTSPVKLLELSHPNNILLKRLLTEAPGTYHHSIIVGNLAESAADAVGGDSLLVRVGAYYHDIGKLKRPFFFIENQMSSENPHDKIGPSLSTLIITSHVKDGVEIAREHKLPQGIIDIIEQHHGTSMVGYFYHKAMESEHSESVTEEEFRYEGPKPQTKEAAIVMLADSVEAAIRSLQNRTLARAEGLVRKFIKDKLNDGQLEECDLTFKELDIIANAFVRVLSGIFHSRVEYPDLSQEIERRKRRAGFRKQSAGRGSAGQSSG